MSINEKDLFYKNYHTYKKLDAFDLAVVHIFHDKKNKPYKLTDRNRLVYLQVYKAINHKGKTLFETFSFDNTEARRIMEKSIKKTTKKFSEWEKSDFSIKYEPYIIAKNYVVQKKLQELGISNPDIYFESIVNEYKRFFNHRGKRII